MILIIVLLVLSDNTTMATRPKDFSTHQGGGLFCGNRSKFSQAVRKSVGERVIRVVLETFHPPRGVWRLFGAWGLNPPSPSPIHKY